MLRRSLLSVLANLHYTFFGLSLVRETCDKNRGEGGTGSAIALPQRVTKKKVLYPYNFELIVSLTTFKVAPRSLCESTCSKSKVS